MPDQQSQDQGHTDIDTELSLLEVSGSGIVIDLHGDLIDSGKGMQYQRYRVLPVPSFPWSVHRNLSGGRNPLR